MPDAIENERYSAYNKEIMAWVEAITNDTEPCVKPEEAAQVVKVLEALYISARNGGKPYEPGKEA